MLRCKNEFKYSDSSVFSFRVHSGTDPTDKTVISVFCTIIFAMILRILISVFSSADKVNVFL